MSLEPRQGSFQLIEAVVERFDGRPCFPAHLVSVLCKLASCAEMAAFACAEKPFRDYLKLKYAIPSHDTFYEIFGVIDSTVLDTAFGEELADVTALLRKGDVVANDGKALRDALDKDKSARMIMMVSDYVSRLRRTLSIVTADRGTEFDAAIEALGLIALKGRVATDDALHLNRRRVAAINAGDWCLAAGAERQSGVPSI